MTPDQGPPLAVPASLRAAVAAIRGAHTPGPAGRAPLVWLPTGETQLVVHVTPAGALRATLSGPTTIARYRIIEPGPFYVQLVLRPGATLGVPAHELADRAVDLPARALLARVSPDPQATVDAIAPLLRIEPPPPLVARAASLLGRVADVADALGVGERTLRRAFLDRVGISPKRYARIARVRRVIASAGRAGWAQLAAEHDFADQPHLNAEFRALLGVSPRQFLEGSLPFVRR